MPWFRVDDGLHSHRKVKSIPRKDRAAAMGLWVLAGAWSADNLTDGHVPAYMIGELGCPPRLADLLVKAELWRADSDGFRFHDWSTRQPTREQVEGDREAARERMRRLRSGEQSPNYARTSSVTQGEVRDPRPVPSRPSSGSVVSHSPAVPRDKRTTDQPDLDKIAAELGQPTAWARRVVNDVLGRAGSTPGDVTAYVLSAIRTEPKRYQPTPGPPPVARLCEHGRDRLTCTDCGGQR